MFPTGVGIIVDDRGHGAVLGIDPDLYPEDVVLNAAYLLTDRCHVHVGRGDGGALTAEIRLKDGSGGEALSQICGEFCNALIDAALRAMVTETTADIREALLKRAFSEMAPRHLAG